jgi:ParB-like chromosome segregation protein Spo0J
MTRAKKAIDEPPVEDSTGIEIVPIGSVYIDPANVRRHGERNLAAIAASLARFGQVKPIVVDGKGVVRAGNGTLEAARGLGWAEIRVIRTGLAGSEATAYAIADNRTAELAGWDEPGLAETLRALQGEGIDLAALGFVDWEAGRLLGKEEDAGEVVDDPRGEWQGMPEFEHEDQTAEGAFIIRVFLKDEEDLAAFGRLLGKDLTGRKFVWFSKQPLGETYEAVDG